MGFVTHTPLEGHKSNSRNLKKATTIDLVEEDGSG